MIRYLDRQPCFSPCGYAVWSVHVPSAVASQLAAACSDGILESASSGGRRTVVMVVVGRHCWHSMTCFLQPQGTRLEHWTEAAGGTGSSTISLSGHTVWGSFRLKMLHFGGSGDETAPENQESVVHAGTMHGWGEPGRSLTNWRTSWPKEEGGKRYCSSTRTWGGVYKT
jgi:hypothetical protein